MEILSNGKYYCLTKDEKREYKKRYRLREAIPKEVFDKYERQLHCNENVRDYGYKRSSKDLLKDVQKIEEQDRVNEAWREYREWN
jgi:hypothetical protein